MHRLMARHTRDGAKVLSGADGHHHVVFEHAPDGSWSARLASRPAIAVRGGSIAQARKRMRDILGADGTRGAEVRLSEAIVLPRSGADAVARLDRARAALDDAEREAVTVLVRRLGLSVRDAAAALGLSARRIVHLAGEVADRDAERDAGRRLAARSR